MYVAQRSEWLADGWSRENEKEILPSEKGEAPTGTVCILQMRAGRCHASLRRADRNEKIKEEEEEEVKAKKGTDRNRQEGALVIVLLLAARCLF